jgi:mono/diheme cytochrome c family protein
MPRTSRHIGIALLAVLMSLLAMGCYNAKTGDTEIHGIAKFKLPVVPETGSHKVIVFSEMHYQPKFDSQEIPRLLPPSDSVPITGREIEYASLEKYAPLTVPDSVNENYSRADAGELYRINCQVCHGASMSGDGLVVPFMTRGAKPVNLNAEITQQSAEGELFAYITEGGRQGYALTSLGRESTSPMPRFKLLLTEDERWALVKFLRGQ